MGLIQRCLVLSVFALGLNAHAEVIQKLAPPPAHSELVDRIVAIVNDDIITQSDLIKYADRLKTGGLTDDLMFPDEATKEAAIKDSDKLLQKMIDEKVIDSEIKKENLSVAIEQVEQEIRSIAKRNNVSRDELKSALQERGITFSDYQDFIKRGLERQSLIGKAITSRIKISEDDVLSAFAAAHGGSGEQAFEYTLSHIFFSSEKGGSPAAHKRAEETLKKLRAGANWDQAAADMSEDPSFELGGTLGVFKTGELQAELESVVQKLAPGDFSNVLSTQGGYHIVRVNKKKIIADPRTEKERDKLRAQLYDTAYKKQFASWLYLLRQDSFIRVNAK
jgi:peptidyl-prolyl cis-trans isomerase SurA